MNEVARQIAEMITAEFKRRGIVVSVNEVDKAATALAKPGVADIEWTFVNSYHQMVWDDSHNFIRFKAKEIKDEHAATVARTARSTSNVSHVKAKALWLAFHAGDEHEAKGWNNMQEKSRQKWVDLSDKLEAEKKAIEDKAAWKEAELRADVVRAERKSTMVAVGGTPGGVECRVMFRQGVVERSLSDRQLDRIRTMPPLIRAMTQDSNAWVVGSQAEFREGKVNIKPTSDWDVIVPYAEWEGAMTRLASAGVLPDAKFTSVGGMRLTIPAKNGGTIGLDIWPGEISHHMMKPFTHVAWQPKTGSVWVRGE